MRIERIQKGYLVVHEHDAGSTLFTDFDDAKRFVYTNEELLTRRLINTVEQEDYLDYEWKTQKEGVIRIGDMERSHVQNTLNWCIRRSAEFNNPDAEKDNVLYSQWIAYFMRRLLDPEFND